MKKYLISIISFLIGAGCMITYNIIGTEVAADGTLIEPFALLPLGYIFLFIGVVSLIYVFATKNNK